MRELDRWDWQRRAVRAEEENAKLRQSLKRAEAKIQALQAKSHAVKASRVAKQKLRPRNRPMK